MKQVPHSKVLMGLWRLLHPMTKPYKYETISIEIFRGKQDKIIFIKLNFDRKKNCDYRKSTDNNFKLVIN